MQDFVAESSTQATGFARIDLADEVNPPVGDAEPLELLAIGLEDTESESIGLTNPSHSSTLNSFGSRFCILAFSTSL